MSATPQGDPVVVIGAGPAGLTAAYKLLAQGRRSVVFEKDDVVGGISRTVHHDGYHFDIGGHRFFTKVRPVEEMWREVLPESDFLHRQRLSRIYYNKRFFDYPLRATNALFGLGLVNSVLIGFSYAWIRLFPIPDERSFEDWVTNRFGRRLYRTFFKTYTEKVWGIPCTELSAEWAAQRIKGLSMISALKSALLPQRGTKGKDVIKTLIDSFHYPKRGPGMMWETVAEKIQAGGHELHMNADVTRLAWEPGRVTRVEYAGAAGGGEQHGSHFVSTMPVRELVRKLDPPPPAHVLEAADRLRYRDFLTVALIVGQRELFPDNWIYIHDPDVKVGRVQNFKNWSPHMVPDPEKSCVGLEYFCFEGDGLWTTPDDELIALGANEMDRLGLIRESDVEAGAVVRMPKAYPVYDADYKEALAVVREFVDGLENLYLVGRNGMHKYNNQDHSMLTAMLAVENIGGAKHDIWAVNADQDYHEEVTEDDRERAREYAALSATQPQVPMPMPALSPADRVLQKAFGRLHAKALGTAFGAVGALYVFAATAWLLLRGGDVVGPNLILLREFFLGYDMTWPGAFVGAVYAAVLGFMLGWSIARIRNLMLDAYLGLVRRKAEAQQIEDA